MNLEILEDMTGDELAVLLFRAEMVQRKRINGIEPAPKMQVAELAVSEVEDKPIIERNQLNDTCERCGARFVQKSNVGYYFQKYCSRYCQNEARRITNGLGRLPIVVEDKPEISNAQTIPNPLCKNCGKEFSRSYAAQSFCGRECGEEYYAKRSQEIADYNKSIASESPSPQLPRGVVKCKGCDNAFTTIGKGVAQKIFCSQKCRNSFNKRIRKDESITIQMPPPINNIIAPPRNCKQCGEPLPPTSNPSRIFCGEYCGLVYHEALKKRVADKGDNIKNIQLPLYTHTDPVPELSFSKRHRIIFELLKIAGITIASKGYYIFTGRPYSSGDNFDAISNLIPSGTAGSQKRINAINRHMETFLGADPERIWPSKKVLVNSYRILCIKTDLLTDDDKLVIREMEANYRRNQSRKNNRAGASVAA